MNHTDTTHSVIKNLQWLFRLKGRENETRIIQQQVLKKEEQVKVKGKRQSPHKITLQSAEQKKVAAEKRKDVTMISLVNQDFART